MGLIKNRIMSIPIQREINLRKSEEVYYFFAEILSMQLLCLLLSNFKHVIKTSLIFWNNKSF